MVLLRGLDLNEVAHFPDHAPDCRRVIEDDRLVHAGQPQTSDRVLLIVRPVDARTDQRDFQLERHVPYPWSASSVLPRERTVSSAERSCCSAATVAWMTL